MKTPHSAASYDAIPDFGLLYDSVPAYAERGDIAFYSALAVESAGPVLEVGCGTGRILLPIARAGVPITGIDGSAEMLARLDAKLSAESLEVRGRVTTLRGDASDFDVAAKFPLVIAPFRVLQQLTSLEAQLGFVRAAARHLAPGGRFVFDVFNPFYAMMVRDRSAETEDTPERMLDDGRLFRRTASIPRVRWTEQVSEIELIYYLTEQGASEPQRLVQRFEMRWYQRAELVHLLARAGLTVVDVYGDFDRSPLTDTSQEQVVIATNNHGIP